MSEQSRIVPINPEYAEKLLDGVCSGHGIERKDEYEPHEVAEIVRKLGYEATPATPAEFVRKGYISVPDDRWDASAICVLVGAMFVRRRWLPSPCVHDDHKSP